jgi:hypothetical protein
MALRLRRGTDSDRLTITPEAGEPIYTTDTKLLYVGDGTTAGGRLVIGTLVDDTTPQLGGNLDLNGNNITGTGSINIDGTITATGNINLGDGAEDNVIVGGVIASNLIPDSDKTYNLGSSSNSWRNGFFGGVTVDGQLDAQSVNADIIADDSTVVFNAATSTFSGTFEGYLTGDVKGSVFGDDSSRYITATVNSHRSRLQHTRYVDQWTYCILKR